MLAPPRIDGGGIDPVFSELPYRDNLPTMGCATSNQAYWALVSCLGVPADMFFGLSIGEVSALIAAGSLDFEGMAPVYWKVETREEAVRKNGCSLMVGTTADHLSACLKTYADLFHAFHITPNLQIVGGDAVQVERLTVALRSSGYWAQSLPYPPIHTPRFLHMRKIIEAVLANIELHPPSLPVYSGLSGEPIPQSTAAVRNAIISNADHPVRFWQSVKAMHRDGARLFLQVGAATTLNQQVRTIVEDPSVIALATDSEARTAIDQLNHLCAALVTCGINLNLEFLFRYRNVQKVDWAPPPTHAFEAPPVLQTVEGKEKRPDVTDAPRKETRATRVGMPFIGTVLSHMPEKRIETQYTLELGEHLYLNDHLFIYAEGVKPNSACLPVLPMAFSLEMMAEVAACLAPNLGVIGFEGIRALQWTDFKDESSISLKVSAEITGEDPPTRTKRIKVSVSKGKGSMKTISGTVVFGERYLVSMAVNFDGSEPIAKPKISAEQAYAERYLFHGPSLRNIVHISGMGEHTIVGHIRITTNDCLFRSYRQPELLACPVFLDNVAQLFGTWFIGKRQRGLPFSIEKIEVYRPQPAPGSIVPVFIQITRVGSKLIHTDVEVHDGAGQVWFRIKNWGFWIFHYTDRAIDFLRLPQKYGLCVPQNGNGLPQKAYGVSISQRDLGDLQYDWLARTSLHTSEMTVFNQMAGNPPEQVRYLLMRTVAKDAVRGWLKREGTTGGLHPASFSLEEGDGGSYWVREVQGGEKWPKVTVSSVADGYLAVAK